ncbi:hypothetical protein M404DRAFT_744224 [Pisolithus tinctorius Marx 270]|uniref:Uncharacterized protein n=1 Tax=Pisolithus tinctorius Marx 270 TaxID=870435 RepID=A0A0C3JUL9_PISTI|nr:hypothetical protein M404DRAFT_744224 [Pisolithus tinctorius Marx 270]
MFAFCKRISINWGGQETNARRTYNASKVLWKMLAHLSETISVDKMAMVFFDPRNLLIRCIILQKTDGSSWASLGPSEGWIERRLV